MSLRPSRIRPGLVPVEESGGPRDRWKRRTDDHDPTLHPRLSPDPPPPSTESRFVGHSYTLPPSTSSTFCVGDGPSGG